MSRRRVGDFPIRHRQSSGAVLFKERLVYLVSSLGERLVLAMDDFLSEPKECWTLMEDSLEPVPAKLLGRLHGLNVVQRGDLEPEVSLFVFPDEASARRFQPPSRAAFGSPKTKR